MHGSIKSTITISSHYTSISLAFMMSVTVVHHHCFTNSKCNALVHILQNLQLLYGSCLHLNLLKSLRPWQRKWRTKEREQVQIHARVCMRSRHFIELVCRYLTCWIFSSCSVDRGVCYSRVRNHGVPLYICFPPDIAYNRPKMTPIVRMHCLQQLHCFSILSS